MNAELRLQQALDAAALSGARALEDASQTDADIIEIASETLAANLLTGPRDVICGDADVLIGREAGTVKVAAACELVTTMGGIAGVEKVALGGSATARAAITKLDIALMLDVSGSMAGSKLEDLKTSAKDAIDILISDKSGDRVRIGFNTYSTSVNPGAYASSIFDPHLKVVPKCVSERSGMAAWTDDAPGNNRWLGTQATQCPTSSIMPLTSDASALKTQIDSFVANGYTAGHIGVAWAWYLISPEWASVWPSASKPHEYDEPNSIKAVILMTDGEFNTEYAKSQGKSDKQARTLCDKMRDEDVLVYAIAFDAPGSARKTLRECAGDKARFFEADNGDELNSAYRNIASQLSNLTLTD